MVFWDEIAALVSHDFPDVTWDKELVDAMTMRMVRQPRTIDTVVATNLHADILSDLAAALAGSLGIAPTGNIDPERRGPSMFEPIHGSRVRHHRQGHRQPGGDLLDRGDDAGASRREARRRAADARGGAGVRRGHHDARSGRQGDDGGSDAGGVRGGTRDEPLMDEAFTAEERKLLEQARTLVPVLAERAKATNDARDVVPETIADFHRTGILRIIQPCRFGGLQLRFSLFSRIVEILAEGCASSGWVYAGTRRTSVAARVVSATGTDRCVGRRSASRSIVLARATRRRRTRRRRLAIERAVFVLKRQYLRALGDHRRLSRRAR